MTGSPGPKVPVTCVSVRSETRRSLSDLSPHSPPASLRDEHTRRSVSCNAPLFRRSVFTFHSGRSGLTPSGVNGCSAAWPPGLCSELRGPGVPGDDVWRNDAPNRRGEAQVFFWSGARSQVTRKRHANRRRSVDPHKKMEFELESVEISPCSQTGVFFRGFFQPDMVGLKPFGQSSSRRLFINNPPINPEGFIHQESTLVGPWLDLNCALPAPPSQVASHLPVDVDLARDARLLSTEATPRLVRAAEWPSHGGCFTHPRTAVGWNGGGWSPPCFL